MSSRKLRNPDDGELYDVPEADADAALAAGYTAGEKLINPDDGAEYDVPHADVEAARAAGYTPRSAKGADPFAEFGGQATDPFAEFGGQSTEGSAQSSPAEEPGFLSQAWDGIKGIPAAAQTLAEGVMSPLGVRAPVAAAEALPNYLVDKASDLYRGTDRADFSRTMDEARADIERRAGEFEPTATVGRFGGDTAATLLTGGLGTAALGAKATQVLGAVGEALPTVAKVASSTAKLLGSGLSSVVKAGAELVGEGVVFGAEQAAATQVDDTIAKGDWKSLGEKLYSSVPHAALEGAAWNTLIGGTVRMGVLGIKKVAGGKAPLAEDEMALKVGNAATEPTPQTAHVYEADMPLRSSDVVDVGTDAAKAARAMTTPDVAKAVQADALTTVERDLTRMRDIEATHEGHVAETAEGAFDNLAVRNAGERTTQTSNVHDDRLPIRASHIEDAGTPAEINARRQVTPEHVAKIHEDTLNSLEANANRRAEIESTLDHALRLRQKTEYLKTYKNEWKGDSFDELLKQNGLSDITLEKLASDTQGEGGASIKQIIRTIERERTNLPNGGAMSAPKTRRGALGEEIIVGNAAQGPTEGEIIHALDAVKRTAQKAAAKRGGLVHEALLEPTEGLRRTLENPELFDPLAAEAQKKVNGVWAPDIAAQREAGHYYREGRINAEAVGGDKYDLIDVIDRDKLKGLVTTIGKAGANEAAEEAFRARARQRIQSFNERLRWGGDEPANRKLLQEYSQLTLDAEHQLNKAALANRYAEQGLAGRSVDRAHQALHVDGRVDTQALHGLMSKLGTKASESAEEGIKTQLRLNEQNLSPKLAAEYRRLRLSVEGNLNRVGLANRYAAQNEAKLPISAAGAIHQIAEGTLQSTPLIGGAYKAAKSVYAAWKTTRAADASAAALGIKDAVVRAQAKLDKASKLSGFLASTAEKAPKVARIASVEAARPSQVSLSAPSFSNVKRELDKVDALANPDSDESKKTLTRIEELREHGGDELANAYATQLSSRNAFLLEKAGPASPGSVSGRGKGRSFDDETAKQLQRYLDAVEDPTGAIERVGDGESTPEDTETLKTLYPDMWSEFRQKAVRHVSELAQPLSFDQDVMLSDALGVALAPELSDDNVAFWAQFAAGSMAAKQQQNEQEQAVKGGAKIKLNPDSFKSKGDRLG